MAKKDANQPTLFAGDTFPLPIATPPRPVVPPASKPGSPDDAIQRAFEKFHHEHPQVYRKLRELAFQVLQHGYEHYGIGALWERMRWHFAFEVKEAEVFKLNNNYRSRYARLLMAQEPELKDFFETRELAVNRGA